MWTQRDGVPIWMKITPVAGSLFHERTHWPTRRSRNKPCGKAELRSDEHSTRSGRNGCRCRLGGAGNGLKFNVRRPLSVAASCRSYQRNSMLERRRPIMQAWANLLSDKTPTTVVSIGSRQKGSLSIAATPRAPSTTRRTQPEGAPLLASWRRMPHTTSRRA